MRRSVKPRTCVACRRERLPREMLRVVRTPDGQVILDERGKQSGRGAYVCPEPECVTICFKKRLLEKSLKVEIPSEVTSRIKELAGVGDADTAPDMNTLRDRICGTLGIAHRAGELIIGQDRVLESLSAGKNLLVLLTDDHSPTLKRAMDAKNAETHILYGISRTELGQSLGLRQAQVAALPARGGFAGKIAGLLAGRASETPDNTRGNPDAASGRMPENIKEGGKAIE